MTQNEHQVQKDLPDENGPVEPEFCLVNYAMVINLNVDDIPRLIRFIKSLPRSYIVYQTKSIGKLTIQRE